MRRLRGHLRSLVVGALALSLLATMLIAFLPGNATASPSWQVGDKWAIAGEKDIGQVWDALGPAFTSGFPDTGPPTNLTLTSTSFHGTITMYALFEVTAVTASNVTIQISLAANLTISANAAVNVNLPPAGTYNNTVPYTPTFVNMDITASSQIVAGSSGTITVVATRDTMAFESVDASINSYMKGYVAVVNMPNVTYDQPHTEMTVNYITLNCSIDMNAVTGMHVTISPGLQVISDTMNVGDVHDAIANVTSTETISGSVNVAGLPQMIRDLIFTADAAQWGITGFPINLGQISNPSDSGMPLHDGTISTSSGEMNTHMAFLRNTTADDAVTGTVAAREYSLNEGGSTDIFSFLIDPANGHALGSTSTIPMGETQVIFSTHAAPVASAQTAITAIDTQVSERQSYATVTGSTGGTGTGGGLPISTDLLIIIVVIVVAVVVVVGVVMMRRKK
jgi:hypothetical protein